MITELPTIAKQGLRVVLSFEDHDNAEEMYEWLVENIRELCEE